MLVISEVCVPLSVMVIQRYGIGGGLTPRVVSDPFLLGASVFVASGVLWIVVVMRWGQERQAEAVRYESDQRELALDHIRKVCWAVLWVFGGLGLALLMLMTGLLDRVLA